MYFDITKNGEKKRVEILHGTEEDWEDAMALCWRVFKACDAADYPVRGCESFLEFISDQFLKKMFLLGRYRLYVAKAGGVIIGVAGLRENSHISLLFTDTAYQGFGIGRALVETVCMYLKEDADERWLPENEDEKINDLLFVRSEENVVTVNSAPSATGFYENMGFGYLGGRLEKDGIIYVPMKKDL